MIRIIICSGSEELAQRSFSQAKEALQSRHLNCELAYTTKPAAVQRRLLENAYYYNILVLDIRDPQCCRLAGTVRKQNLLASVIFVAEERVDPCPFLKYRPSACVAEPDGGMVEALLGCYKEQFRLNPYLTVKSKDRLLRIPHDDILYFESRLRVVTVHTKRQSVDFYGKLDDILQLLPPVFIRCHQSYIVNMDYVRQLDKTNHCCIMMSGKNIDISKSRYTDVVGRFESYVNQR